MFNELDVSFICDLGSTPIAFFKMWQDMTIGIQPGQAAPEPIYSKDSRYHNLPHMAYAQRYYDDYTADVVINKLEKYGNNHRKQNTFTKHASRSNFFFPGNQSLFSFSGNHSLATVPMVYQKTLL